MGKWFAWLWEYVKAFFRSLGKWVVRYPIAAAVTIVVVLVAVLALVSGKKFQLGGLLGKLWGTKPKDNKRGIPPKDRVDEDGKVIQPGESDEKGFVQAPAIKGIKEQGLFDDPNTVTVVHPEKGEVTIDLPKGVKNKDVKEVIEIEPDVYEVRNNDDGVDTDELLNILGEE